MPKPSERLDEMIRGDVPRSGFTELMRLARPVKWEPGELWLEWEVDRDFFLSSDNPVLFGGYTAALIDQAAALALSTVLEEGQAWTTSDLRVSYFRPITGGTVAIDARVVHQNRSGFHVEVVIERDDGKLAAKGTVVQAIIQPRAPRAGTPAADGGAAS